MRNRIRRCAFFALAGTFAGGAAQAQAISDPAAQCNLTVGAGFSAQQKVAACDAAIKSGGLRGDDMTRAVAERGTGYLDAGQFAAALRDFDDALAQLAGDPQSPYRISILNARGFVYIQLERPARALRDFQAVLGLTPGFAEVYVGRAEALAQLRLGAAAAAEASLAIAANPRLSDGYGARSQAYYLMGEYARAIPDLDQAIQLDPTRYEAWLGRGQVYTATARFALAVHDLEEAQRLRPDNDNVRKALEVARSAEAERLARIATAPPLDLTADAPSRPIAQTHDCTLLDKVDAISESGTVQIGYDVAPDGTTTNVVVTQSSGMPLLDQSGVDCVSQLWRSLPAVSGGVAVASPGHRADIEFSFRAEAGDVPGKAADYVCRQAAVRGHYDEAVAACTQAIALDAKSAAYVEHRGLAHLGQGRAPDAMADFQSALRLDPALASAADERDLAKDMAAASPAPKPQRSSRPAI